MVPESLADESTMPHKIKAVEMNAYRYSSPPALTFYLLYLLSTAFPPVRFYGRYHDFTSRPRKLLVFAEEGSPNSSKQFIADGKAILMGTDAVARIGQKNAFVNEEIAEWLLLGSSTDFEG